MNDEKYRPETEHDEAPDSAHCWEGGPDASDGCGTTCMLFEGHEGPHKFTRDDEITVRFL